MIEEEVLLNDQGLKVKCIIDDNDISFEFDKNISFLNKLLKIESVRDFKLVSLGLKKILKISKDKIERILPITNTELKVLCAYNNALEELKSNKDVSSFFKEVKNRIEVSMYNMKNLNKKSFESKQKIDTEFHTHFVEILSSKEFLDYVNKYEITLPINNEGYLDFEAGEEYSYKDIVLNGWDNNLLESLSLKDDSSFNDLVTINKIRNNILNRCAKKYESTLDDREWNKTEEIINGNKEKIINKIHDLKELKKTKKKSKHSKINIAISRLNDELTKLANYKATYCSCVVYNELFDISLDKLTKDGINYSEITYSNEKRIKYISDMHKGDNRFKILFGMDISKKIKDFESMSKQLESLLNDGVVIGVDILGNGHKIDGSDYSDFKEKLEWLLPVLHVHPNSILRIHDSELNVYNALKAIKEVSNKINESCVDLFGEEWGVVPPPRIRIGHGINIEKQPELINLLHEFDATVEYSISSNYIPGDDLDTLSIDSYHENDINYVLSTDGEMNNIQDTNSELFMEIKSEKELTKKDEIEKRVLKDESPYSSYSDALDDENMRFFGIGDESDKIDQELSRIKKYIMDNNVDYDEDYFNYRINKILEYRKSTLGDFSKIYLYIFENEMFPEIDSSFKSVEYIRDDRVHHNNLDNELSKIYRLVYDVYDDDSLELKGIRR